MEISSSPPGFGPTSSLSQGGFTRVHDQIQYLRHFARVCRNLHVKPTNQMCRTYAAQKLNGKVRHVSIEPFVLILQLGKMILLALHHFGRRLGNKLFIGELPL